MEMIKLIYGSCTFCSQVKKSDLKVRLVSPSPDLPFVGRVEVFYNSQWGTICDDSFSYSETRVVCGMLNYTAGLCTVSGADLGEGSGNSIETSCYTGTPEISRAQMYTMFTTLVVVVVSKVHQWGQTENYVIVLKVCVGMSY